MRMTTQVCVLFANLWFKNKAYRLEPLNALRGRSWAEAELLKSARFPLPSHRIRSTRANGDRARNQISSTGPQ
jgi:hypothetical protein